MQIIKAEAIPVELDLRHPVQMANTPAFDKIKAIFIRLDLKDGRRSWGGCVVGPELTGEQFEVVLKACQDCCAVAVDFHPTNIEYSLAQVDLITKSIRSAATAFDLALHDLLGLASGLPLYRLLGGYRDRIQTSVTVPLVSVQESVEIALQRAAEGFQILKIKGGIDPEKDVRCVRAISSALPNHVLRLDVDGGYSVQDAIEVANALRDKLEMIEQPTSMEHIESLSLVRKNCHVPILADQSVRGPASALRIASKQAADGISVKMATCGGFRCARQLDGIARASGMELMVSCLVEPALLIAAGLSFALSSPNVKYGDLDGNLDVTNDPTIPGFRLEDGWLISSDTPGLGCRMDL
jgi:L-alanine-DL-glutamate epimerase-like enolase superfamily enzyme